MADAVRKYLDSRDYRAHGGPLTPGNIDLAKQPVVKNRDGSTSTVHSFSSNIDGKEALLPLVMPDGRRFPETDWGMSQAENEYLKTSKHLGIFPTPSDATHYADKLRRDYESGRIKMTNPTPVNPKRGGE